MRVASSRLAPRVASVLPAPAITASGVRKSCEIDASRVLRRLSASAATRAAFRRLGEPRALDGECDLACERLEQMALLGQQHAPLIVR